jgi:hypothetical protein
MSKHKKAFRKSPGRFFIALCKLPLPREQK